MNLMEYLKQKKEEGQVVTLVERGAISLVAGGIGAVIGNPADLALIRLQADGTLPKAERRGYKNAGDALSRIVNEEGFFALW